MTAENRCRLSYVVADFLSTNLAFMLFNVFRYYELPIAYQTFNSLGEFMSSQMLIAGQICFPLGMMLIYYMAGNYSEVYLRSRASELISTVFTSLVGTLLVIFIALINDLTLDRTRDYALFMVLFLLLFVLVYLPRMILTVRNHNKLRTGKVSFPTLIVGYASDPDMFRRQTEKMLPKIGMRPVAFIDHENRSDAIRNMFEIPVHDFKDIASVCESQQISNIIVIPHPEGIDRTMEVVAPLYALDRPVYIAADDMPAYAFRNQILNLKAEPYIDVTGGPLNASTMCSKRVADVVVSALALTVLAVPMALVGLMVKIDSRGPMFYKQKRIGRGRKEFEIIKLRTMNIDSEPDGTPALSSSGDKRVTRIGRVLRKYRIDEIPQLLNVLRGDMSLVGPRPERLYYVRQIALQEPGYPLVHRVRPGITSLGMVKYGYASTVEQMVIRSRYDLLYIDHISIVTDLKIILYTIRTIVAGRGV